MSIPEGPGTPKRGRAEGAILAGGQSRRMGQDKARLVLSGQSLLARVAAAMGPVTTRVRIIGDARQAGGMNAVSDLKPGLGPLGGIQTALATAEEEWVLVVACDLPFVSTRFLRSLVELAGNEDVDVVAPRTERGPVAVCAAYRRSALPVIAEHLDRGALKAADCLESSGLSVRWVAPPKDDSLLNLNTPEDYKRALEIAATERK